MRPLLPSTPPSPPPPPPNLTKPPGVLPLLFLLVLLTMATTTPLLPLRACAAALPAAFGGPSTGAAMALARRRRRGRGLLSPAFLLPHAAAAPFASQRGRSGRHRPPAPPASASASALLSSSEDDGPPPPSSSLTSPFASAYHAPVMWREVLDWLITDPQGLYLDCTLGGGGHSEAILSHLQGQGKLVALDQDPDALAFAGKRLAAQAAAGRFQAVRANFRAAADVLAGEGILSPGAVAGTSPGPFDGTLDVHHPSDMSHWLMIPPSSHTTQQACCWTWACRRTSWTRHRGYVMCILLVFLGGLGGGVSPSPLPMEPTNQSNNPPSRPYFLYRVLASAAMGLWTCACRLVFLVSVCSCVCFASFIPRT